MRVGTRVLKSSSLYCHFRKTYPLMEAPSVLEHGERMLWKHHFVNALLQTLYHPHFTDGGTEAQRLSCRLPPLPPETCAYLFHSALRGQAGRRGEQQRNHYETLSR